MWFVVQLLVWNGDWSLKYVDHYLPLTERINNLQRYPLINIKATTPWYSDALKYACRSAHVFFLSLGQVSEFDETAQLDRLLKYYRSDQSIFLIITKKQQQTNVAPKIRYMYILFMHKAHFVRNAFFSKFTQKTTPK